MEHCTAVEIHELKPYLSAKRNFNITVMNRKGKPEAYMYRALPLVHSFQTNETMLYIICEYKHMWEKYLYQIPDKKECNWQSKLMNSWLLLSFLFK